MVRGLLYSALISAAGVALCATPAFATTPLPAPTGYVNDLAGVLSASAKTSLEAELSAFEKSTSNEIVVATVPSMAGDYIEHYAPALFAEWGIGKKDKDNGVLLLLSIQEHAIRIEVGYGLEGALPDSVAQSIINNDLTPRLKAGDYDGAVTSAVADIESATKGEYTTDQSSGSTVPVKDYFFLFVFLPLIILQWLGAILGRSKSWWAGGIVGGVGGAILWSLFGFALLTGGLVFGGLVLFGLLFDYIVSRAYGRSQALGIHPPWWIGGGGGGFGSGGGFGGFGGGSSGGGGASGSW